MRYTIPSLLAVAAIPAIAQGTIVLTAATTTISATTAAAALAYGAVVVGGLSLAAASLGALLGGGGKTGKSRDAAQCLPFNNPEVYLNMAANSDFLACGRRFVCELAATKDDKLEQEEAQIKDFFSRSGEPEEGSAGAFFQEAAALGEAEGTAACQAAFSACPYDRKVIFNAFREIQGDNADKVL